MAKLTTWVLAIIAVLLLLTAAGISLGALLDKWAVPILVAVIAVGKLMRNYGKK
jgi:purine-cytosine permease-like protein